MNIMNNTPQDLNASSGLLNQSANLLKKTVVQKHLYQTYAATQPGLTQNPSIPSSYFPFLNQLGMNNFNNLRNMQMPPSQTTNINRQNADIQQQGSNQMLNAGGLPFIPPQPHFQQFGGFPNNILPHAYAQTQQQLFGAANFLPVNNSKVVALHEHQLNPNQAGFLRPKN